MFQKVLMKMSMLAATPSAATTSNEVLTMVTNYITAVLGSIIGVAAMVAIVYAIFVGAKMAKANNAEEREEAKKKVIFTVAGIGVAIALMIILFVIKDKVPGWLGTNNTTTTSMIGLL